ncbi:hypothetical protein [Paenibacillus sp. S150]|uniref:hypothetical protein n=1 Tax=Paenibacillus sp. S150 TaxID=2749826 RepID=UPI001C57860A|nr:hypothetical protein [Paenibacillus sp. S150]MBW4084200.1 hypothetical protein [Paenibacillus sp. S150]
MICRHQLLKSIQAVHLAVVAYANCICDEIDEQERELLFASGLELSKQLAELRNMYIKQYKTDPITGFQPLTMTCGCQED